MRTLLIILLSALLATPAFAGKLDDVSMPDEITVEGRKLELNGMGKREATLGIDVYVAGLYLEKKNIYGAIILAQEQAWRISMKFVHDVDRDKLVDAWKAGFKKNGHKSNAETDAGVKTLCAYMSGVSDGDTMEFTYVPGKGTTIVINGKTKGEIAGADFGKGLLAIWLGPNPPNEGLQKGMLGR